MSENLINLGIDLGNGAFKLYGALGHYQLESHVATNSGQRVHSTMGLKKSKPPMEIKNKSGDFFVGAGAHDYGRFLENLDVVRFGGTPETETLLHGIITKYQQKHGPFKSPVSVTVGLPNEVLTGDIAEANIDATKKWLRGIHTWRADGKQYSVEIEDPPKVASQATGALFDHLLDLEGQFIPERKGLFSEEIGLISVGFGTVELMVVRNRTPVARFTIGATSGVRRLLEIVNGEGLYSLGEMDMRLRAGQLDISTALLIWEREVMGVIEKQWGNAWKRFAVVLIMGGGSILLKDTLPYRFNGKAFLPDQPVITIARGLYKLALYQQARKSK